MLFKFDGNNAVNLSSLSAKELTVLFNFAAREVTARLKSKTSAIHEIDFTEQNPILEALLMVDNAYDELLDNLVKEDEELLLEGAIEKSLKQVTTEAAPEPKAKKKATKKV